ncbi:MAG: hypothetical protein V5A62_14190 [Haloarculaceae archaeon]
MAPPLATRQILLDRIPRRMTNWRAVGIGFFVRVVAGLLAFALP